ncbi:hypothetical protein CBP31_03625 [Oceanisphaera profunda]|uniref:Uncharacterized protein n=1 Tax=Oceanisphaera profunda TaxID=1416627 RepID=A0A1Y0D2S2_9GAMM|nr:hypothetical protein CBP31_03625 [Oceanisphaera profunda]
MKKTKNKKRRAPSTKHQASSLSEKAPEQLFWGFLLVMLNLIQYQHDGPGISLLSLKLQLQILTFVRMTAKTKHRINRFGVLYSSRFTLHILIQTQDDK